MVTAVLLLRVSHSSLKLLSVFFFRVAPTVLLSNALHFPSNSFSPANFATGGCDLRHCTSNCHCVMGKIFLLNLPSPPKKVLCARHLSSVSNFLLKFCVLANLFASKDFATCLIAEAIVIVPLVRLLLLEILCAHL